MILRSSYTPSIPLLLGGEGILLRFKTRTSCELGYNCGLPSFDHASSHSVMHIMEKLQAWKALIVQLQKES